MDKSRTWILLICAAQAAFVAAVIAWVALVGGDHPTVNAESADPAAEQQLRSESSAPSGHGDY